MKKTKHRFWTLMVVTVMLLMSFTAKAEETYQLTVTASPAMAGTFNTNRETLEAGATISLYAYSNDNFTFVRWKDDKGNVVSQQMSLTYKMPTRNVTLTAEYEYNPLNPANPARNYWNKEQGEVIVDDFTTGSLQSAVKNVIGDSKTTDVQMITVSGVVNSNDLSIINTYSSCFLLDLSRVSGVTQVPSYAFDYTNLETVYLPATIEKIGYRAFADCSKLSSLTIYAMTPPTLESQVFQGVPDGLVVYVPAAAISQYQDIEAWGKFTLLPIQEDIRSISISLPEGANASDYTQMWLELTNAKSGQRMHYVMTNRQTYTFANIIRNTSWNVTLRNERGDVFGQIDNVEVKDEDVSVTFASLSKPQNVSLVVKTPDGQDVTAQTQITWTDAQGNYVAQGASLTGLPAGYQTNYRVALPQELAMQYDTPQAVEYVLKDGGNGIVCQLKAIKQVQISGKVKDAATGLSLSGAVVSASQTFGGKYSKTLNVKTDSKGSFTLTVANVPTSMAFAASDYVSQTMSLNTSEFDGLNEFAVPDVSLKSITGATISVGFTYTSVDGEAQNWYSDYQNVSYTLYNITREKPIGQFNVQYPQIVLLEEVEDGDVLRLTATSRTNAFKPVEATATIAEQKAEATFGIVELGQIQSSFTSTGNASVVGSLYDAAGKLVKIYDYANASLTISNLADGNYTLVTMGSSRLFNTIYDLEQLPQTGLVEDVDYVVNTVEVKSGQVSAINISEVPTLDESKLYYTGDNTSFTVNKPSIVAGNYLTLTGRIDFKPAYATGVSNVQMIVDLPESCEFVENSVMVGNSTSRYTLNGNRITIPMTRYTDRVRFCIIPTLGGEYAPSAFAQFDIDGETVTQPIGSANYTAKDLSISVPSTVKKKEILVSGTALGASNIEIYDNSVLIGQTTSLANGTWVTTCELNEPYNLSRHLIYAKVTTKQGIELVTEVKECQYDINTNEVKTVTMSFYNGWLKRNVSVLFDFQNGTTYPTSYQFYNATNFTFVADFLNNDTTAISDVMFHVFTDDNKVTHLSALYDKGSDKWVASSSFDARALPKNLSVSFNDITEIAKDTLSANETLEKLIKSFEEKDSLEILVDELEQVLNETNVNIEKRDSILDVIYIINVNRIRDRAKNPPKDYGKPTPTDDTPFPNAPSPSDVAEIIASSGSDDEKMYKGLKNLSFPSLEDVLGYLDKFIPKEYDLRDKKTPTLPNNAYFPDISMNISSVEKDKLKTAVNNIADFISSMRNWYIDEDYTLKEGNFKIANEKGDNIVFYQEGTSSEKLLDNNWDEILNGATNELTKASLGVWCYQYANNLEAIELTNAIRSGHLEAKTLLEANAKNAKNLGNWSKFLGVISLGVGAASTYLDVKKVGKSIHSWDEIIDKIYELCDEDEAKYITEIAEEYKSWILYRTEFKAFGSGCTVGITAGSLLAAPETLGLSLIATLAGGAGTWCLNHWEKEFMKSDKINKSDIFKLANNSSKCKPFPIDEFPEAYFDPITGIHDPSGYVYEGVSSNRIEGVTATAYYKEMVEDMYGDLHENIVKWDAEEYAQENPLFTDENGYYRWDVPQGLWQVKFEKEGYETTYSEWLPVPPPQLDVNIAMKQNVQPTVKNARAYEDAVEVEFDKYMMPELLTAENISVMQNGTTVKGTVELLNEEVSYEGEKETFASKIRFNATEPFDATEVKLWVSNRVKSYAGTKMQDDYQQTFTIEQEIREIQSDSAKTVGYGDKATLIVNVLPASASKGKTLTVKTSSPMILGVETEQVSIGNDGKAEVMLSGELPGTAALTFSVEGTDKTATTIANVEQNVNANIATPTANIASGTVVEKGTAIILSCTTEGATIYYTTDGTCPCDETGSRKVYDGTPIVIGSTVTIKAMAVAPDLTESDVAEFVYTVQPEDEQGDVNSDGKVNGTDLVLLTNLIMSDLYGSSADMNNDGKVNGTDYVLMVNVIMNMGQNAKAKSSKQLTLPASLTIEDFDIKAGETKEMLIDLRNINTDVTLVQFDLRLPAGLSIATENGTNIADIAGRTTWKKHTLLNNNLKSKTRFLLCSSTNALITGSDGAIIKIGLTSADNFDGGTITLENQLIVTPAAEETVPATYRYVIGGTSSVDASVLNQGSSASDVFTLNGSKVRTKSAETKGLPKGIYIVNGQKITIK